MAAHSKRTPEMFDRMIAMHSDGASANAIGEALGLDHGTVCKWLREKGLEPNGTGGRKPKSPREGPSPEEQAAALVAAEAETALLTPTADVSVASDMIRRRHAEIARLVEAKFPHVVAGSFSAPLYKHLLDIEMKLAMEIRILTPPHPPDPERDPVNLDAAASVHRKVALMVADNEKDLVCANCGKHPFKKVG